MSMEYHFIFLIPYSFKEQQHMLRLALFPTKVNAIFEILCQPADVNQYGRRTRGDIVILQHKTCTVVLCKCYERATLKYREALLLVDINCILQVRWNDKFTSVYININLITKMCFSNIQRMFQYVVKPWTGWMKGWHISNNVRLRGE